MGVLWAELNSECFSVSWKLLKNLMKLFFSEFFRVKFFNDIWGEKTSFFSFQIALEFSKTPEEASKWTFCLKVTFNQHYVSKLSDIGLYHRYLATNNHFQRQGFGYLWKITSLDDHFIMLTYSRFCEFTALGVQKWITRSTRYRCQRPNF